MAFAYFCYRESDLALSVQQKNSANSQTYWQQDTISVECKKRVMS